MNQPTLLLSPLRFDHNAGQLELIDQLKLPGTELWHRYSSHRTVAEAIKTMVVRGAPAIGIAAAFGVVLGAREGAPLDAVIATLRATRPTAVNLFWAIGRMRRRIDAVRRVNADVHIGTDIIVGFPSEGDAEFQETLDFCRAADFANIHIFPFSKRRNTPIVEWLEKREGSAAKRIYREINGQVIRERAAALAQLKAEMAAAYAQRMAGKEFWATVEKTTEGLAQFTTENYLRGSIADTQLRRGERFRVTL